MNTLAPDVSLVGEQRVKPVTFPKGPHLVVFLQEIMTLTLVQPDIHIIYFTS